MELSLWEIARLKPYPNNPREITQDDVAKMAAEIERRGFLLPIEVYGDGIIVAGHRRLLAAKKLGLARVPVIYHEGMTDEEASAYRLSSNRLASDVKWNRSQLADELVSLEALGLPPDTLGFDDKEIAKLFDLDLADQPEPKPAKPEDPIIGPFLRPLETWDIGVGMITIPEGATPQQLSKFEEFLIKAQRWTKSPAKLDDKTLKEVLATRAAEQGLRF